MKSICNLCGNVEHHQLALHTTCGSGKCEGKQMLPKPMSYETRQYLITQRYKWDVESDINDPDDGSWKGR